MNYTKAILSAAIITMVLAVPLHVQAEPGELPARVEALEATVVSSDNPATNIILAQANTTGVRKPKGNIEAFWERFSWAELSPAEQTLWNKLGWDETSWGNHRAVQPASDDKYWRQLTREERAAAKQLGYKQASWDEED